jgi:hypothetical protein
MSCVDWCQLCTGGGVRQGWGKPIMVINPRCRSGELVVMEHPCPMNADQWDYFGTGDMAIFCQVHRKYWLGFTSWWSRHRGDQPSLTGRGPTSCKRPSSCNTLGTDVRMTVPTVPMYA